MPVLSVQIKVTAPNVSTAGKFLIKTCCLSILLAPSAREIVITAGKASGTAATAKLNAVSAMVMKGCPCRTPASKTIMHTHKIANTKYLLKELRRTCSGVLACFARSNKFAMRPISVLIPLATTTPLPFPKVTTLPLKARLLLSPNASFGESNGSVCLVTASDSPVSVDSSICNPCTVNSRISAGTIFPCSNNTMSPGTTL